MRSLLLAIVLTISSIATVADESSIKNLIRHGDNISGGQPSEQALTAFAKRGGKTIINLRYADETEFNEAEIAQKLGLTYIQLETSGSDLKLDHVKAFDALISDLDEPYFIHCASGNRVGALMALRASWLHDATDAEALVTGKKWGMTKLEPLVTLLLEEGPEPVE